MPYDNSLRDFWASAGYRRNMGSAAVCMPPASDKIRLYHFTSADHALSNIRHSRLKVARLSDLNDPFELMALNFRYGAVRKVVREFKTALNIQKGILCFTEDWTNPVMWSHYAEKHQGICLGFDIPRASVERVEYEDKRLLPELGASDDPCQLTEELQSLLLRTKFHHWSYEEEHRMFISLGNTHLENGHHFRHFANDIELKEVIIGPLCDHAQDEVHNVTKHFHPSALTFCARLAWQHFKIVPIESSVP